jgi:hypothetical protein
MTMTLRLAAWPRALIYLLLLALLFAMLALGGLVVGSWRYAAVALPTPIGPARNGLLAYDSAGDIWVSEADGTGARQLTSGPERDVSPVWSRDGTKIAFWSAPTAGSDGWSVDFSKPEISLMVMNADGTHRQALADGVSFDGVNLEFSWAPDGHAIAFARDSGTTTVVTIASLDGGPLTDIVDGAACGDGRPLGRRGPGAADAVIRVRRSVLDAELVTRRLLGRCLLGQ